MKGLTKAMKTDIESSINEAEVCRSMGLFSDSLSIYEKILGSVSPQDTQTHDKIEKRIRLLKQEIDSHEESAPKGVSAKDITMLRKRLSDQGDVPAILDRALRMLAKSAFPVQSNRRIERPAKQSKTRKKRCRPH